MRSIRIIYVASCVALSLPRVAAAQEPGDLRVGAVRPAEAGQVMTHGGLRTPAGMQPTPVVAPLSRDYRISPNDLIDIEVLDAENLRRTVRVNAAGAVSLPLIGTVTIGGLTSQEAEARIAGRYAEKYLQNPQVSLFIKEFTTERITVEGAVGRPGMFPITGHMTLLRVLAVAGGFGPIANTKQVMLYRANEQKTRESYVFDVEKIRAGEAEDPVIKGDDLIVVQRDSTRALLKDSLLRDVIDSINPFSPLIPR